MEDKEKPWFDWYAWHIKYWGTKWNAYDGYTVIKKSSVQFVFSTAWSVPEPIYSKLTEMFKDYNMETKWADESLGSNCGEAVHCAGEEGWDIHWKDKDPNACQWAKRLWDTY